MIEELDRVANRKLRFDGQTNPIYLTAKLDVQTDRVVIDLGPEYGPKSDGAAMEDLQGEMYEASRQLLNDLIVFKGVDLVFGGKDMYHYHPEQWRARGVRPNFGATLTVRSGLVQVFWMRC